MAKKVTRANYRWDDNILAAAVKSLEASSWRESYNNFLEISKTKKFSFEAFKIKVRGLDMKPSFRGTGRETKTEERKVQLLDDLIQYFDEKLPRLPKLSHVRTRRTKPKKAEAAVAVWGDFHIGAWVDPESTASLCQYSWAIFKERFRTLVEVTIRLGELKAGDVNTLWILLNGDMVDGANIYPGHAYNKDRALSTIDQAVDGAAVVSEGIYRLSMEYKNVNILCVPGNHGRIGNKGELPYNDNLDYLFYRILALRLKENKRVNMSISTSPWAAVNIEGNNFVCAHGDQIHGSMGIPFYGGARAAGRIATLTEIPLHALILGHHHNIGSFDVNDTEVIFNGSMVGGSDLSTNRMFLASTPKQYLMHVHKKYGITDKRIIKLGARPRLQEREDSVLTPFRTD